VFFVRLRVPEKRRVKRDEVVVFVDYELECVEQYGEYVGVLRRDSPRRIQARSRGADPYEVVESLARATGNVRAMRYARDQARFWYG